MLDSRFSELLYFLSEPRSLEEIAEHFAISTSIANRYLQKAIRENQILACRYSTRGHLKSQRKQGQSETLVYISKDSDLLSRELTGFAVEKVVRTQKGVGSETTFIRFSSEDPSKSSSNSMQRVSRGKNYELADQNSTSLPQIMVRKGKFVRSAREPLATGKRKSQSQARSFSIAQELSMLTALSQNTRSYVDLQTRFKVSRRTLRTLVKKGILKEVWGARNIGITFQLTEKGKKHLKRLKTAARLKRDKIRNLGIQLKHRI
jgi:DNA-binding MarR family transcriptional regulator